MQFDTSISLDMVISILAILAAVWRLESKFDKKLSELRSELKGNIADLRADNGELRKEFKADNAELRNESSISFIADTGRTALGRQRFDKADYVELRNELKADNAELRKEFKADNAELRKEIKSDYAELRIDLRRVEGKVDDSNQRLARLEGIILAREDMVDTVVGTSQ